MTFENYTEYVEAATAMRLHEFDSACAAMRRGMVRSMCARVCCTVPDDRRCVTAAVQTSLVPERALRLFTWRELELMVRPLPLSHAGLVGVVAI